MSENEEQDPRKSVPWEGIEDESLLGVAERIAEFTAYATASLTYTQAVARNVDEDQHSLPFVWTPTELQAICFGLNLTGFFSSEYGELAKEIMGKVFDARSWHSSTLSEQQKEELAQAQEEAAVESMAEMFGLTPEEFKKYSEAREEDDPNNN